MIRYELGPARAQQQLGTQPFHRFTFDDGTVWTEFHRSTDGYLLRFPDLADFEVSADGREVIGHPAIDTDDVTIEHLYINQLVPLAMSRQGMPAFHASVVTVPGGAVAFLGKTGMGKSTLAASFALDDAQFLTDDALIVDESDGTCRAMPSHASLRLWDDSVDALVGDEAPAVGTISYSSKTRLLAGDALSHRNEPVPLLAAYLLECGEADNTTIQPLAGAQRHMAWVENSFLLDIEDRELLAQHFDWTHRISSAVPTFALDYPRDYGILPQVHHAIRQHVRTLP